ncbi:hypothetical protein D3C76_1194370 [compost metagenome]
MLQIGRIGLGLELFGQQLAGGVGLAQLVQDFDLHDQCRQVVRCKAQGIFEGLLGLLVFGIVQVQPGQLVLVVGAFRGAFQYLLPGIDGLFQRPEVQAQIIR